MSPCGSQEKLEDFLFALGYCIHFLGGVTELLVPDNMKTAVVKASRYEPSLNQALDDLANHYGMAVLPARVAHPRDKASVEGHVKIAYTQIYARLRKRQFFSLEDLNNAILECVVKLNQSRMQGKSFSREEKFLAEEKPLLKPLPQAFFQYKQYGIYTVAKNGHVRLSEDKHYYSVPYQHAGKKVKVIYTRSLVEVFFRGERIAVHLRNRTPHKYTFVKEHLASHHQHYLDRSPDYYIEKAGSVSMKLRELFVRIFDQDRHPELLYNTCNGILAMSRKTSVEKIDKACRIALDIGNYSYGFFSNLVKNNMIEGSGYTTRDAPLASHGNIRGKDYYQKQLTLIQ